MLFGAGVQPVVAEIAHRSDIEISKKMYAALPKFGAYETSDGERPYLRELDMGNDRDDFVSEGEVPIIEGRMIEAFDYRAKRYVSGHGRSARWASNRRRSTRRPRIAIS